MSISKMSSKLLIAMRFEKVRPRRFGSGRLTLIRIRLEFWPKKIRMNIRPKEILMSISRKKIHVGVRRA